MVKQVKKKSQRSKTRRLANRSIVNDDIDVREEADLNKFSELSAKHPILLVFIYADWCGHCTTYKPIWEKLKATINRQMPMARMNESMLSNSPLSNAKISGYPSVVLFGTKDKSLASFKDSDSGEMNNSIPNIRDESAMTKLIRANPSKVMDMNNSSQDNNTQDSISRSNPGEEDYTARPTARAEYALRKAAKKAIRDIAKKNVEESIPAPPDVTKDVIESRPERRLQTRRKSRGEIFGGSLYNTLMNI